jgi:hypothetical protein
MGEPSSPFHEHDSGLRPSHGFVWVSTDDASAVPTPAATQVSDKRHFIVAVDFGTTFSCVSVHCRRDSASDIESSQINSISNYPYASTFISQGPSEVPTQSWYPKSMPFRQPLDTGASDGDEDGLNNTRTDVDGDVAMVDGHALNNNQRNDDHYTEEEDLVNADEDQYDFVDDDNEIVDRYYWGYGVAKVLATPDSHREQSRRILRSKLLLDRSVHTKHIRTQLSATVKDLRARKLIRDETDIIADFLINLLRHAKSQMEIQYNYHSECSVEFVICVPAMWTEKACRIMQNAMTRASRESEFIENSNHDVDNLFIVTEPEAASTHVLDQTNEILV